MPSKVRSSVKILIWHFCQYINNFRNLKLPVKSAREDFWKFHREQFFMPLKISPNLLAFSESRCLCVTLFISRGKKPWLRIPGSPILYSAAAWAAKKDQAVFNWLYRFWQKVPAFGVGLNSLVNSSWASPIKKYPIIDSSVFEKLMPTR